MDPINYSVDVKSPFEQAIQGYGAGTAIRNDQQQQVQAQQQQTQQKQMNQDLVALSANKNAGAQDYVSMMTKYPSLSEHLKKSFDVLNEDQKQTRISEGTQVYAALNSGNIDIAKQLLKRKLEAAKNSGDNQGAAGAEALLGMIDLNPEAAKTSAALMLSSVMGPDKFGATFQELQNQSRADVKLPYEVAKTQEEITTAQHKRKIDDLDIQIKQADSETKRGELQLQRDKLVAEMGQMNQTKSDDAQTKIDGLNQSIQTVDALMNHPGLNSGTGIGGSVTSFFNGTDAKDFRLQIETIKSQQFLTAAKELKGMGALSDAEGLRLEKAVASLDPNMSTAQFKNNLGVIRATLQKAQAKVVAGGKLPSSGGGFVMKHPQFGNVSEGDINRLLTQHPGSTREQVIQFLKSTGGN